jgi:hypothetical protein
MISGNGSLEHNHFMSCGTGQRQDRAKDVRVELLGLGPCFDFVPAQ